MISSRKHLLLAGLLATASLASAGAFAQQQPLTAPVPAAAAAAEAQVGAQATAKPQHSRADRAQRFERMQAHRAKRMAALKEKLKLTPAQDSAWSSFAAAQQPPARDAAKARMNRAEMAKLTTPERLDRMQARQAERSARAAKRADATRSFYAALSPDQQKTFDAESAMRFGHGRHGGRHEHRAAPETKS